MIFSPRGEMLTTNIAKQIWFSPANFREERLPCHVTMHENVRKATNASEVKKRGMDRGGGWARLGEGGGGGVRRYQTLQVVRGYFLSMLHHDGASHRQALGRGWALLPLPLRLLSDSVSVPTSSSAPSRSSPSGTCLVPRDDIHTKSPLTRTIKIH